MAAGLPSFQLDATRLAAGSQTVDDVLGWVDTQTGDTPILIYSSAEPEVIRDVQARLKRLRSGG